VSALRPYEILVIVDPRPTDEEVAALLTQLGEQFKGLGAEVTKMENWGKRRLAYDIRKQREGTYAVFETSAEPAMVKEFERQLRLNENVLRFLATCVPTRSKKARDRAAAAAAREPAPTGDNALEEVV
jgi:small subunit ribosomal protein S6